MKRLTYANNNTDGLNKAYNVVTKTDCFCRPDTGNHAPEREGINQEWMRRGQALFAKYK